MKIEENSLFYYYQHSLFLFIDVKGAVIINLLLKHYIPSGCYNSCTNSPNVFYY